MSEKDSSTTFVTQRYPLTCHPSTLTSAVRAITVDVGRLPDATLALRYRLQGTLERLRIPKPRAPRVGTDLWKHTCFEVFVAREGTPAYHEFNFSPSTEWAAYLFRRYRDGKTLDDPALRPWTAVHRRRSVLELTASIPLHCLSPQHRRTPLRLALAAVVEEDDGTISYWALRHLQGKPDFHHADGFAAFVPSAVTRTESGAALGQGEGGNRSRTS